MCRSGLPFFYACSCLFYGLLTQTLPDVIPIFVQSQSALCDHPACRKLSDHLREFSAGQAVSGLREMLNGHPGDSVYL
jgi:hypothetical protein